MPDHKVNVKKSKRNGLPWWLVLSGVWMVVVVVIFFLLFVKVVFLLLFYFVDLLGNYGIGAIPAVLLYFLMGLGLVIIVLWKFDI